MAYPSQYNSGFCPDSHPKRFVSIFYEVTFKVDAFKDMWYGDSQPFVLSTGDTTGYGFHGDFLNGWDVPTLQRAVTECRADSGVIEDCHVFDFFTIDFSNGCKVFSSIDEQTSGVLTALPGCNQITSGPEMATASSGCGAVTTFGTPEYNYVDFTASKGFEYVGCGFDFAGKARTLDGASTTSDSMTNSACLDFCTSKGFSIAGTEYSRECYCGNSIADHRMPITGLVGSCNMPCTGDATQTCGGAGTISLYKKCDGASCQNIIYNVHNGTTSVSITSINATTPVIISSAKPVGAVNSAGPILSAGPYANHSTNAIAATTTVTNAAPSFVALVNTISASNEAAFPSDVTVIAIQTVTVIPVAATTTAAAVSFASVAAIGDESQCGVTHTVTVAAITVTVTSFANAETSKSAVAVISKPFGASAATPVNDGENSATAAAVSPSGNSPPTIANAPYGFHNGTWSLRTASGGSSTVHVPTHTPSAGIHGHNSHNHFHRRRGGKNSPLMLRN
jgi:hypothetical protein